MSHAAGNRLYVGNLSSRTRRDDLYDDFRRYGRLITVDVKNGFGFVEFEDPRDAEYAVRRMDNADVDGRRIRVEFAQGRRGPTAGEHGRGGTGQNRVLVHGLGDRTSWQDLKDFARRAGDVRYTDVWVDRGERVGVMEYSSSHDMERALRELDGRSIDGCRVELREDRPHGHGHGRSRSRSRRRSPSRSRRHHSRSPPPPRRASSRSRSRSPRRRSRSASPAPAGRSASRSHSRSRSRSPPPQANAEDADSRNGSGEDYRRDHSRSRSRD